MICSGGGSSDFFFSIFQRLFGACIIHIYQMWEDSRSTSGEYNKLVSVAGVNSPSAKRFAGR